MKRETQKVGRRIWLWPVLALLYLYKFLVSPLLHLLAPGAGCRYEPSCSVYAIDAVRRFGVLRGSWLAGRRFLDCHPWGHFGIDPVPLHWPGWWTRRRLYYAAGAEAPAVKPVARCCHRAPDPS